MTCWNRTSRTRGWTCIRRLPIPSRRTERSAPRLRACVVMKSIKLRLIHGGGPWGLPVVLGRSQAAKRAVLKFHPACAVSIEGAGCYRCCSARAVRQYYGMPGFALTQRGRSSWHVQRARSRAQLPTAPSEAIIRYAAARLGRLKRCRSISTNCSPVCSRQSMKVRRSCASPWSPCLRLCRCSAMVISSTNWADEGPTM